MTGVYVPTEQEIEDCLMGKSCVYGICDECYVCAANDNNESEEEDSEE